MKLLTALTLIGSAAAFAPAQTSSVSCFTGDDCQAELFAHVSSGHVGRFRSFESASHAQPVSP